MIDDLSILGDVTGKAMFGYVMHKGNKLAHLQLSRFGFPEAEFSVLLERRKRAAELSLTFPVVLCLYLLGGFKLSPA